MHTLKLLKEAAAKREPLKSITNAFRLVNGSGDGLEGLVLEQYGRHFAAQIFDKRWLAEKKLLADFVRDYLGAQYFIVKDRTLSPSAAPGGFKAQVWIGQDSSQTVVQENGLKFSVDLAGTLNSGLFLDMRKNRRIVSELARGRKVLNCFAYTCSFGVYCRARGASGVVNVDTSRRYLEGGRINYDLNGLIPARDEFIPGDAMRYLERAVRKDNRFGLIILDPPSFARHKEGVFSVKKHMAHLIELAVKALDAGGILFVATNLSGMTQDDLIDMIAHGAGKRGITRQERLGQDVDFPGSHPMQESYPAAVLAGLD